MEADQQDSARPSLHLDTLQLPNSHEIEISDRQRRSSPALFDRDREGSESERQTWNIKQHIPSAMRAPDRSRPPNFLLDVRFYSMKKTAMTLMCLLMIIMSNSVQLKHVLKQGSSHPFYGTQVSLGIISVLMCTSIGCIQLYTFLFTWHDHLLLPSSFTANLTRYDQLLIVLPAILTILLFLFDATFLAIMFQF
ncbi:unnamed protein product [Adineta ricciae]|uniref:Uncharacterized protein n=1 Tax=Adineta ricciae TaxID=249248 RepID=A0A813XAR0_ADIRI|nr:unnamed protein product [Adineta ricciae]